MAVKVNGLFQNPQNGLIYDSPLLTLVPHLLFKGKLMMDVYIDNNGCIGYQNIDRTQLSYNTEIEDVYTQLIDSLEDFIISDLKSSNQINSNSIFEKYNTIVDISTDNELTVE
jgi:hypothetical protein